MLSAACTQACVLYIPSWDARMQSATFDMSRICHMYTPDIMGPQILPSDTSRPSETGLMCSLSRRHEEEWAGLVTWTKPQVKATWVKDLGKALTTLVVALVSMCRYCAFEGSYSADPLMQCFYTPAFACCGQMHVGQINLTSVLSAKHH